MERIVVTADVGCEENRAAELLADKLGSSPFSAIILMVSPKADFENLAEVFAHDFLTRR